MEQEYIDLIFLDDEAKVFHYFWEAKDEDGRVCTPMAVVQREIVIREDIIQRTLERMRKFRLVEFTLKEDEPDLCNFKFSEAYLLNARRLRAYRHALLLLAQNATTIQLLEKEIDDLRAAVDSKG